jgi:ABC-2 type transport system ATP-binding protein
MKQKVALARALIHEPELLFLDEPTSGLDPEMTRLVRDFIDELHSQGRTILLCTHNLDEAERLCDRVAVIQTRLLALDRPAELRASLFGRQTEVWLRAITEDLINSIRMLEFVNHVASDGEKMIISLDDPETQNPLLVKQLVSAGAEVVSVRERDHSLEDIYLRLVREKKE